MSFVIGISNARFISEKTANDEVVDKMIKNMVDKVFNESGNYL